MRKIKKFKIPLYHYDIYRKAKKIKLDIDNSHFKGQEGLKEFSSILYSNIEPIAVFDYIKPSSHLWTRLNIENNQALASIGFISFGNNFDEKINSLTDDFEKEVSKLISQMFLISSLSMLSDLTNEEIKSDGFEISKPYYLYNWDKEYLNKIIEKDFILNFEKEFLEEILLNLNLENIKFNNTEISPKHSAIYLLTWQSRKKK